MCFWTTAIFIYINDLPISAKVLSFYLFSDDTNIYFELSDIILPQKTINKHLKSVSKWFGDVLLLCNEYSKQPDIHLINVSGRICGETGTKPFSVPDFYENGISHLRQISTHAFCSSLTKKVHA